MRKIQKKQFNFLWTNFCYTKWWSWDQYVFLKYTDKSPGSHHEILINKRNPDLTMNPKTVIDW